MGIAVESLPNVDGEVPVLNEGVELLTPVELAPDPADSVVAPAAREPVPIIKGRDATRPATTKIERRHESDRMPDKIPPLNGQTRVRLLYGSNNVKMHLLRPTFRTFRALRNSAGRDGGE